MLFWSISDCDLNRSSPVSFRSRSARLSSILGEEVSGNKSIMAMKTGAAIHNISHNDHLQPFVVTAKPEINGPSEGPQYALATQLVSA